MSELAIRVCDLGKLYRIGIRKEKYHTLRDHVVDVCLRPIRRAGRLLRGHASGAADLDTVFSALQGVSFEVKRGEVVGIIGRNGAGKTTLLKILTRITTPSSGYADLYGRVGSLLEVGTGFHPELTGRENIYLNGAILGMRKGEINRKFDEIVAFAEVEKFIDTPVKHYSSGMYVRLAFAVAAHLEPEILLIDEVLAVGDAAFQKKCLGKMQDVSEHGRTILFVSHNMAAVSRLCQRTILLDEGRLISDGPTENAIKAYLDEGSGTTAVRRWSEDSTAPGGEVGRLRGASIIGLDERIAEVVEITQPVGVRIEYEVLKPGYVLMSSCHVYNEQGVHLFSSHEVDPRWRRRRRPVGRYVSTAWIPGNLLTEATHVVTVGLTTLEPTIGQFYERDVLGFRVVDGLAEESARGEWAGPMPGVVRPLLKWKTEYAGVDKAASP